MVVVPRTSKKIPDPITLSLRKEEIAFINLHFLDVNTRIKTLSLPPPPPPPATSVCLPRSGQDEET
ncbi:hypothetical protein E2C01_024326 [Portunus trituberculatus]|uniref:Uncharacterized protein n=1 Tax=Portunus trituberculatus TaxID=210409 RepID=A0A5B7EA16_PORTR|nr:hypothetical protein [Portunus trituberculatus]